MVKVLGPAMSLDASGSLADTLVFSKWKGRNYIRQLVKPTNPKSVAQVGMRAMFKFLSQEWNAMVAGDKADWEDLADAINASPFNAYMKENQKNWRDFLAPSQSYPIQRTANPAAETAPAADLSGRNIIVSDTTGAGLAQWGVAIFRELSTAFTTNWDNCIAVIPVAESTAWTFTDGPLEPDQYFYIMRHFSLDGTLGPEGTEVNETVL